MKKIIISLLILLLLPVVNAGSLGIGSDKSLVIGYDPKKLTVSGSSSITNNYYNGTSYNATYDQWAYNQTLEDTTYHYNMTSPFDKWAYNQSSPFYSWLTGFVYNYNQTYTGGTYNITYHTYAYNQSDGSYNVTYATWSYNQSDGSYNATYDQWAYNQTLGAINNLLWNATKPNLLNITGIDDNGCSGTNKVNNVTFTNGVLSINCDTDQTGSGGSSVMINSTYLDISSRNVNVTTIRQQLFTFSLTANNNYSIECLINWKSNTTTTGIITNITTSSHNQLSHIVGGWFGLTTLTAVTTSNCFGALRSCALTNVGYTTGANSYSLQRFVGDIYVGNANEILNVTYANEWGIGGNVTVGNKTRCKLETI